MSAERVFLDTNVIVYAYDRDAGRKHAIARDLMIDLWNRDGAILSTQVLQEFYVTVTKKIAFPLAPDSAREIVADLLTWSVVANDGEAILKAIDLQTREKISFWDALIVASAAKGGAEILVTEDLADGRKFGSLIVRDPFAGSHEKIPPKMKKGDGPFGEPSPSKVHERPESSRFGDLKDQRISSAGRRRRSRRRRAADPCGLGLR